MTLSHQILVESFEEWYLNDLLGEEMFLERNKSNNGVTYKNAIIEMLFNAYSKQNRKELSEVIDIYLNYEMYISFIDCIETTTMVEKDYFIKNKVYKDDFVEFDFVECTFKNPILQALFLGFKMSLDCDEQEDDEITDDEIDDLLDEVEQSQVSDENVEKNKEAKELIEQLKKSVGEYQVKDGLSEFINDFSIVLDDGKTTYQYFPSNFEKELMDYCVVSYFDDEIRDLNKYEEFKELVRNFYYSIDKNDFEKFSTMTKINLKKIISYIVDDVKKKNGGILYS